MRKIIPVSSLALIFVLLLSACQPGGTTIELPFVTINLGNSDSVPPSSSSETVVTEPVIQPAAPTVSESQSVLSIYQDTLIKIYEEVNPSVVNIQVLKAGTQGNGSGFVWDKNGYIVTNNHVIEGAAQIRVRFSDGTSIKASLVGGDPDSDLAVIKVDLPPESLLPVTMGDSAQLKVGQLAIAIGTPFGLEGTMTVGIVSALGRSLPVVNGILETGLRYTIPDVIQTDAPINPGNSGGVLVNDRGEVIGVTSAIESPVRANAGIGYAIPANIVNRVVPALVAEGRFDHPWLGISGTSLTPEIATALDLPSDTRGAMIIDVTSGSPADQAGLRGSDRQVRIEGTAIRAGGDIITAIDGQTITGVDDVIRYLTTNTIPGQQISVSILRDGNPMVMEVTLGSRPTSGQTSAPQVRTTARGASLGIAGVTMFPELAEVIDLNPETRGVLVITVMEGSPAERAGIRGGFRSIQIAGRELLTGGDVITAVDGKTIESIQGLREALDSYDPGNQVAFSLLRAGEELEIEVTLGERSQD
jgi:serine protease Do